MLDEFGLTPEQRKQYLVEGRKQLKINAQHNHSFPGIEVDPNDEDVVLRFILLKKKVEAKREESRQRAIARNNGQPVPSDVRKPVPDSPYERSRKFMEAFRRFMGM